MGAAGCLVPAQYGSRAPEAPIEATDRPSATFVLDGAPFCFVGANNYYMTYKSRRMTDDVLRSARAMGLRVLRIWAFIDRGALDGSVPNVHEKGEKEGVYFQYWDPAARRPAYNDGESGLVHLDYVLEKARELELKIVLVLTNNWKDFGGMDQYLTWYGVGNHHLFYSDPAVVGAYKDWILHLVTRKNAISGTVYRDDPTIFAWELANEPRATNDGPLDSASGWTAGTITAWADQMSAYVKSVDRNHLVAVGDEGFLTAPGRSGLPYDGRYGVDHAALVALKDVDFGTYHLYPDHWKQEDRWGEAWIEEHVELARAAGKPTLLEEYGVTSERDASGKIADEERRAHAYRRWHEMVSKRGGSGSLLWMLGGRDDQERWYPDYDHFTMYENDRTAKWLASSAPRLASDARVCQLFGQLAGRETGGTASRFVKVAAVPARR
jgi:mannan endo-1,4-beta-mannosidase